MVAAGRFDQGDGLRQRAPVPGQQGREQRIG
jgi:hypothetical protein